MGAGTFGSRKVGTSIGFPFCLALNSLPSLPLPGVSRHPHGVEQVVQPSLSAHLLHLVDALRHEARVVLVQTVLSVGGG